jgi:hypothetical protein
VLFALLLASFALNWMQYRGQSAIEAEASGLGSALSAANKRAGQAEQELARFRGAVGDVQDRILSLQDALNDLTSVNASTSTPAEPLAAAGRSGSGEVAFRSDPADLKLEPIAEARAPVEWPRQEAARAAESPTRRPRALRESIAVEAGDKAEMSAQNSQVQLDVAAGAHEESPSIWRRLADKTRAGFRRLLAAVE